MMDKLEVSVGGKVLAFSTNGLSEGVREELYALFYQDGQRKQLSTIELLQAYIIMAEKYVRIHNSLEHLYKEIENAHIAPHSITSV